MICRHGQGFLTLTCTEHVTQDRVANPCTTTQLWLYMHSSSGYMYI